MKLLATSVLLMISMALVPYWKCSLKYNYIGPEDPTVEEELGYYIIDCQFYPAYKDRKECNDFAKYMKCVPYKPRKKELDF